MGLFLISGKNFFFLLSLHVNCNTDIDSLESIPIYFPIVLPVHMLSNCSLLGFKFISAQLLLFIKFRRFNIVIVRL